ncbi:MAG: nuclear transport factor 2 family protein [Chthoniobacterales bacterium]|nr:nuclear transport factor 2 family protein [Chthoniobacterales bacterium]
MKLPQTLVNYFEALNAADGAAAAVLFTENAVVHDEDAEHRGHAAIGAWVAETAGKYQFRVTPLDLRQSGEHVMAGCRLKGSFPGSPVTLDFDFILSGNKISRLSIQ